MDWRLGVHKLGISWRMRNKSLLQTYLGAYGSHLLRRWLLLLGGVRRLPGQGSQEVRLGRQKQPMLPIRDTANTYPATDTYAHPHPNPNAHPDSDPNPYTNAYPDSDAYTNTYATRQDSVYSTGDTGGGNVVRHRIHKLIKHIYLFSTITHVFRMSWWYNLHWRDGVHSVWRALRRELFIRLLLRLLTTNAYTYPYPDTNSHPATYA